MNDIEEMMILSYFDVASKHGVSTDHAQKWMNGLRATIRLARWEPFKNIFQGTKVIITPDLFNNKVASGTTLLEALQDGSSLAHQAAVFSMAVQEYDDEDEACAQFGDKWLKDVGLGHLVDKEWSFMMPLPSESCHK